MFIFYFTVITLASLHSRNELNSPRGSISVCDSYSGSYGAPYTYEGHKFKALNQPPQSACRTLRK